MEVIQARLTQLREDATVSRAMREVNAARTGASAELAIPRARKARRPLRAADAPTRDRTHLDNFVEPTNKPSVTRRVNADVEVNGAADDTGKLNGGGKKESLRRPSEWRLRQVSTSAALPHL